MDRQRILTAAILVPIVVGLILILPAWGFALALGVVIGIAAWEISSLIGMVDTKQRAQYTASVLLCSLVSHLLPTFLVLFLGVLWWFAALAFVVMYEKDLRLPPLYDSAQWRTAIGLLVLVPCWNGLTALRSDQHGLVLLFGLLILIWAADTAAYFAGRRWGQRKLAPNVSPGKTIEGLYGALATTVVLTPALGFMLHASILKTVGLFFLMLITVLFSVLGDLFESVLKRAHGVKDSGNLLPGHGGLLDRIDSLTAASPVFAFGILFLGLA